MKKGLELFNCRAYGEKPNFKILEDNGIFLPPLYKLFFTYFKPEDFFNLYKVEKIDKDENRFPLLTSAVSKIHHSCPGMLYNVSQIINFSKIYDTPNYVIIGTIEGIFLLVGNTNQNEDIVYKHRLNDLAAKHYFELSENIFEYAHSFVELEHVDSKEVRHRLYKNWGEDFWRLREDD